uniref:Uncharacterized protein n=1 Tax=Aegilops tauschii subsp. strangulata TaxID=200361 RepID=A0A453N4K9_AEGTS
RPSPTRSSSPTTSSRIPIDGRSGRSAGTDGVPPARCRSSPSPAVVPPQPQVQRPPLPPAPLLHPLRRPSLYIPREGREGNGPDRGSRDEVRQRPDPRRHRRAVVDLSRHRYRGQPWRGGLTRRQPWMETPQTLAWGPSRHGCSNEEGGQRPGRRHGLTLLCSFPTMTTPWKQQGSLVGTSAAERGHHGGYGSNGSMDAWTPPWKVSLLLSFLSILIAFLMYK